MLVAAVGCCAVGAVFGRLYSRTFKVTEWLAPFSSVAVRTIGYTCPGTPLGGTSPATRSCGTDWLDSTCNDIQLGMPLALKRSESLSRSWNSEATGRVQTKSRPM